MEDAHDDNRRFRLELNDAAFNLRDHFFIVFSAILGQKMFRQRLQVPRWLFRHRRRTRTAAVVVRRYIRRCRWANRRWRSFGLSLVGLRVVGEIQSRRVAGFDLRPDFRRRRGNVDRLGSYSVLIVFESS